MDATNALVKPNVDIAPGTSSREDFAGKEIRVQAEMAAYAVAAQAKAEVEARYVLAMRKPRDWDDVRVRLLKRCKDPSFARSAMYSKPQGGSNITGLSIRFVEEAIRCAGNIYAPSSVVYEDDDKRIVRVMPTDLENNITYPKEIVIEKTVERKNAAGREVVRARQNAQGQVVYVVRATEEEMLMKENNVVSKALRTNGQRLIPGHIQDEARLAIMQTIRDQVANDPEAERKQLADAFAILNIMPSDLKEYLGCELSQVQPKELVELRQLWQGLRDGEFTWRELMATKRAESEADGGSEGETKDSALKEKLKSKRSSGAGQKSPEQQPLST